MAVAADAATLADASFENRPVGTDFSSGSTLTPVLLSGWGIDSAIVTSAENGITPDTGSQMARANSGVGTDSYTMLDFTSLAAQVDQGTVFVDLSAQFNSVAPNTFAVSLHAFSGSFDFEFGDAFGMVTSSDLISDGNAATWEQVDLSNYLVPVGTDYLAVGLHTLFDVANPSYADSVAVEIHGPSVPVMGYLGWLIFSVSIGMAGWSRLRARTS